MILTSSLVLTSGPLAVAQTTDTVCLTEEAWNDRVDREVRYECGLATKKASQRDEAVDGERKAEQKLANANGRIAALSDGIARAQDRALEAAREAAVQKERADRRWSTLGVVLTAIGSAVAGGLVGFFVGSR